MKTLNNRENALQIEQDKIKLFEWKSEGIINLVREDDAGNILSVQIDLEKRLECFAAALAFMEKLHRGNYSKSNGQEVSNFQPIKSMHLNFTDEDIRALAINYTGAKREVMP